MTAADVSEDRPLAVRCRMHGPMIYRFALYRWVCAGFDGEGCENYINAEDVRRLRGWARASAGFPVPTRTSAGGE